MPLRKLLYDALGYCSEITAAGKTQDRSEWSIDEMLSGASKGTKVAPIITIVFYTGEKVWDGPTSLYDMMEIDEQLKPFVPDYPLFVIDMGHDSTLSFPNESLESLRIALWDIYHSTGDHDQTEIQNNIMALAGILANDVKLYRRANNNKGGTITMCEALRKRDEAIRKEVEAEKNAEMDAALAEIRVLKQQLLAYQMAE